jgi:type IV pilus assembly protein PilZ
MTDWDNRRQSPRRAVTLEVEYESMHEFLTDFASNMSLGGMFIETETPLPMGTRFRLKFCLPAQDEPIEAFGEVCWIQEDTPALKGGMGLSFSGIDPTDQRVIEAWLDLWGEE